MYKNRNIFVRIPIAPRFRKSLGIGDKSSNLDKKSLLIIQKSKDNGGLLRDRHVFYFLDQKMLLLRRFKHWFYSTQNAFK